MGGDQYDSSIEGSQVGTAVGEQQATFFWMCQHMSPGARTGGEKRLLVWGGTSLLGWVTVPALAGQ